MGRDVRGAETEAEKAEEAGAVPREHDLGAQEAIEARVEARILEVVALHQHEEALQRHQARQPALRVSRREEVRQLWCREGKGSGRGGGTVVCPGGEGALDRA